ncbi:MAG TPA: thioesterase family protein [Mycobacteriales bacterium]|nr:thioesterase family protein [Mycobacteriales bacterium]
MTELTPTEPMTTEYDAATELIPHGASSFAGELDPAWFVAGPNGGYLAAMLMRAAQSVPATEGRPARSMTVHYPQAGAAGPVLLDVEVNRAGRSLAFATVRMHQADRLLAHSLVALGHGRSDLTFQDLGPPDFPSPDRTAPADLPAELAPPIAHRFDYRPATPMPMFSSDRSDVWCWLRLAERRPIDDPVLSLMVDALAPAMFFRAVTPHVYPTVDLTVHLRNPVPPAYDDWCLAHVATRTAAVGFIEEDCDIYHPSGTLLAQGRQLALMVPFG